MRVYTFSNDIGPFLCEQDDCHKAAYSVVLTDAEAAVIPDEIYGEELAHYIIFHHLGKRTCKSCIKAMGLH